MSLLLLPPLLPFPPSRSSLLLHPPCSFKTKERRHQGNTKEATRRHQGGTKEAPRKHQGGTKEAPRRHQRDTKEPRRMPGCAERLHQGCSRDTPRRHPDAPRRPLRDTLALDFALSRPLAQLLDLGTLSPLEPALAFALALAASPKIYPIENLKIYRTSLNTDRASIEQISNIH